MKRINAVILQAGCDRGTVMYVISALNLVRAVDTGPDRNPVSDPFPDLFDDHPRKTHPVLKASSKLIYTLIGPWRKE